MKKLEIIISHRRLDDVSEILKDANTGGMSHYRIEGRGEKTAVADEVLEVARKDIVDKLREAKLPAHRSVYRSRKKHGHLCDFQTVLQKGSTPRPLRSRPSAVPLRKYRSRTLAELRRGSSSRALHRRSWPS